MARVVSNKGNATQILSPAVSITQNFNTTLTVAKAPLVPRVATFNYLN